MLRKKFKFLCHLLKKKKLEKYVKKLPTVKRIKNYN